MAKLDYQTIKNGSVVDAVKDWIIDQLVKGNLRPGSKLPTEAELCANLGASRNSVREAVKQLEAYGVVYIKRAEGTFVTEGFEPKMLSPLLFSFILQNNRWEDFVELRRAIDIGTLFVLVSRQLGEHEMEQLKKSLEELEATLARPSLDVTEITEADCHFHNTIISLTRNPQLATLSEYINRITVPSREKTTESVIASGEVESYIGLHRQLYNIIETGDRSGIEKAVMDHYVFWEKFKG